mmetsp:Transcript_5040/g.7577  ORF Transcript_5040/g.7577 Transcript_5040/m.7577 type:complete len:119 (-) Transcript_5040:1651-2007(-)
MRRSTETQSQMKESDKIGFTSNCSSSSVSHLSEKYRQMLRQRPERGSSPLFNEKTAIVSPHPTGPLGNLNHQNPFLSSIKLKPSPEATPVKIHKGKKHDTLRWQVGQPRNLARPHQGD